MKVKDDTLKKSLRKRANLLGVEQGGNDKLKQWKRKRLMEGYNNRLN